MEYITLAIRPYDFEDIKAGILEDIESGNYEEYTQEDIIDDFVYDTINEYYSCDSENAKSIINNYYSLYFKLDIEPGYYDGLQIILDTDFCFDTEEDKKQCLDDLESLKKCLIDLAGVGYVACVPFWVMTYYDYNETIKKIDEATEAMKTDIINSISFEEEEKERRAAV